MRDITKCHPTLQKKAKELVKRCADKGLKIAIGECLRTVAEQDALYAKGRTTGVKGHTVTNAPGYSYSSHHMWGTAFDFYRADGKEPYYDKDGFFTKVGKIGKSLGLEWGGDWKSPVDKPHFQLPDWGSTTKQLKAIYGTPKKFMATWKTGKALETSGKEEYNVKTIQKGSTGRAVRVWQIIIGVTADGEFGENTATKTKKFQKEHGLTADGVVGRLTWNKGLETL